MEIICKACGQHHKSSSKLETSLRQLPPGKKIRIKCSKCGEPILLGREMAGAHKASGGSVTPQSRTIRIKPPEPPDTSWLDGGVYDEEEIVSDIPQAMVLMPDEETREQVTKALNGLGYQAETIEDTDHALEKMQFFNYSSIVMHSQFEKGGLKVNKFHNYLYSMDMSRRRYIFYVLVGPEFNTFYNLQALTYSANLVVAEDDIKHFGTILRKSIPEYEQLFGPYMEELKVQGR